MPSLNDKNAFVTAAGQGIGRAIALCYASAGAQVTAVDINNEALQELASVSGITTVQLDVTDDAALKDAIRFADPELLVNVAGMVHHGTILECSDEDWEQAMNLNARSMYVACKAALQAMVQRRNGCIINLSSVASSLRAIPVRFAYSVSKAAILGLTKSLAADFVTSGIRVNAICPGTVRSPSWEQRVRDLAARDGISEEEALQRFVSRQPMGRVGEPDEIAALALYLATDAAHFVTGQAICIDGGWSM